MRQIRRPSHGTVVAYMALFVALGGTAYAGGLIGPGDIANNAIRSRHILSGAVRNIDLATDAVTGIKVLDGSLSLADLDVTVTVVNVSYGALAAGVCGFGSASVPGLSQGEGAMAYSTGDWDNRLLIGGVEAHEGALAVRVCNHTSDTNLGAGSGNIVLLRF